MSHKEAAKALFCEGLYCSQAVFGAFCEEHGLPQKTALKISCGLNSGVRSGEVCGAVSGAILVLGLCYGHDDGGDIESKAMCNRKTEEFVAAFKHKNGSIVCRDLLGCDISTPEGVRVAKEKTLFQTTCVNMVSDAAEILEGLI